MLITLLFSVFKSSASDIIQFGGLAFLLMLVFVETGLLIGIFVPGGGSVLVTAGLFAGTSVLPTPIYVLIPLVILACTLGDLTGYILGFALGPGLEKRGDTWFFKRHHLQYARDFYARHGFIAFIIGRYLPFIRTLNPLVAGLTRMHVLHYLLLCSTGTVVWVISMMGSSYVIGQQFPVLKKHLGLLAIVIILVSVLPAVVRILSSRPNKSQV